MDKEEASQPAQEMKPKTARGKKANDDTSTEPATQSTAFAVTCSATMDATKASAAPVSAAIGSPPAVPFMVLAVASQNKATVPSL